MNKKWYLSKTIWVNVIATAAIITQTITGHQVISQESQALILTGINIILRIITKHELTL